MGQFQHFEASREASKSITALKHHQPQPSPCELQDRQHQHKQKLSLSHQRHGAVLFQLWSASNLTKCQCFTRLDSYKTSQMWWQCIGLCNYSGAFLCASSRTEAESRSSQHSVFMLFCGERPCRCFWVFCKAERCCQWSEGALWETAQTRHTLCQARPSVLKWEC